MKPTRIARQYVLLSPEDCDPPHGLDLTPGSRDSIKVEWLTEMFARDGFDPNEPALVGYPLDGKIQLLSGTHRHEAAKRAGIRLPVHIALRSYVEAIFGTDEWLLFLKDIRVRDLEAVEISEGGRAVALGDRIDPARDFVDVDTPGESR